MLKGTAGNAERVMPRMKLFDHNLYTEQVIPYPRPEVFAFFARAENLEQITPPSLKFKITSPLPIHAGKGTMIDYRLSLFGIPFRWKTMITVWKPDECFVDEQLQGPYRQWIHTHWFRKVEGGTMVCDSVVYRLPFFPFGEVSYPLVSLQLKQIFDYRARRLNELFKTDRKVCPVIRA